MPPARPRAIDDSRSETSSTITNLKEKSALNTASGAGISKSKRVPPPLLNGTLRSTVNGVVPAVAAVAADGDPSLPRTDWISFSPSVLHSYRTAYRLPTTTSYTHPHAEIIYKSSEIALRAPSAVLARRRLRDLKHQRRKAETLNGTRSNADNGKTKQRDKDGETERSKKTNTYQKENDESSGAHSQGRPSPAQHGETTMQPPSIAAEYIGKQSPIALATAVRKHFNAQQLNEAETVARFTYVARQGVARTAVRIEGGDGDGSGWSMGSNGREVRKGDGGEVGFRLRFRP